MADSQDNLNPSEQKKLAELEQQLGKDKASKSTANADKSTESEKTKDTNKPFAKKSEEPTKSIRSSRVIPNQPKEKGAAKTGALWFFTLINLLLVIAIVGAGYWAWLQWQAINQQQADAIVQQQSALNKQLQSVNQQQSDIAQSIDANQLAEQAWQQQNQSLQNGMQSLVEQTQLINAQVEANQRNLEDISGRRPSDWLLAEADYLVRMAGRKLWLEHDVKTAMMMLQSADSRIEDLDDPSLLPLRALLAEDLQGLQQINPVSTSNIALTLGAMLKQVDTLPLAFFKRPEAEVKEEDVSESIDDWRTNLARNWNDFIDRFFSYKQVTTEVKPFMSEQQQWLSREQLKFSLMQAQIAVLQEEQALYQAFLQTAETLLNEYFEIDKESVMQFSNALRDLQAADFERQYPEQFRVSGSLKDVIDRRLENRFVNGSN